MATFQLLLLAATALLPPYAHAKSSIPMNDNQKSCKCYQVLTSNSSEPQEQSYFQYHRFYDFRTLDPTYDAEGNEPPVTEDVVSDARARGYDEDFALNSSDWNRDWDVQNWGKGTGDDAPVAMVNMPNNIWIGKNQDEEDTNFLGLRTVRFNEETQGVSEIDALQKNLLHASIRFRARVTGDPGAVAGLFTYFDDTNESDIEILTSDPNTTYRFTNQPSVKHGDDIPGSSIRLDNLPPWDEWRTLRLDWLPKVTRWWIDDNFVAENSYSVPRKPSGVVLNMWSNGGEWSSEMRVGDSARMEVQWVQVVFNTSGKRDGPGSKRRRSLWEVDAESTEEKRIEKRAEKLCSTICVIDGTEREGFPEVVYQDPNGAAARAMGSIWVTVVVTGIVAAVSWL